MGPTVRTPGRVGDETLHPDEKGGSADGEGTEGDQYDDDGCAKRAKGEAQEGEPERGFGPEVGEDEEGGERRDEEENLGFVFGWYFGGISAEA